MIGQFKNIMKDLDMEEEVAVSVNGAQTGNENRNY